MTALQTQGLLHTFGPYDVDALKLPQCNKIALARPYIAQKAVYKEPQSLGYPQPNSRALLTRTPIKRNPTSRSPRTQQPGLCLSLSLGLTSKSDKKGGSPLGRVDISKGTVEAPTIGLCLEFLGAHVLSTASRGLDLLGPT